MGRRFANILETVGNTPVVRINRLAPPDVNLYVKIEAFNPLGSVKDRLALGVIEAAERAGQLKPGQTVVEATSGNTGIGLAMVCAQKGYPLVITMAETFSVERRRLMRFLGAKVVLTPAAQRGMGMVTKAVELAKMRGWFLTRQFENEANPDIHSRTTALEILEDFKGEPLDFWVTGYGTGGTLKGVSRVLAKERPETKIIVCEPEDAQLLGSGVAQQRNPDGSPRYEATYEINSSLEISVPEFAQLVSHEVVPGHVTDFALAQALYIERKLGFEATVLTMNTRGATLSEGLANNAILMAHGVTEIDQLPDDDMKIGALLPLLQDDAKNQSSWLTWKEGRPQKEVASILRREFLCSEERAE